MSHVFLKKRINKKRYLEVRRKTGIVGSANTIRAKKLLRKLDKQNHATKHYKTK
jgi:hypothetical protein